MKTTFDYAKWLKERAEKDATKTVDFNALTKVEKISALLFLLDKTKADMADVKIVGIEERAFGECSAQAKAAVLTEVIKRMQAGESVGIPSDKDIVCVPVKTSFAAASMNDQISYLSDLYCKAVDVITIDLPAGEAWVTGLTNHIEADFLADIAGYDEADYQAFLADLENRRKPFSTLTLVGKTEKGILITPEK